MPRVTRRSVAAMEDSTPEESPRSSGRGRRSAAKKEEPKEEEVAIGEPQETTPKRGGRQAKTKEPEMKTPTSKTKASPRGKGRGRRSQNVVENADKEEEEDETHVEEEQKEKSEEKEKVQWKGRGKDKGANASPATTETSFSRSSSRSTRGRTAKEVETPVVEAKSAEESPTTPKNRGSRGRGKAKVETTPSPRAGRSSRRGRSAADDEVEETEQEVEETKNTPSKKEVKGEAGRKAPEHHAEAKKFQEAKSVSDRSEVEVKNKEESMDTAEDKAVEPLPNKDKESSEQPKSTTPTKKRKLEDDDEKISPKRSKTVDKKSAQTTEFSDYVVINKEDVPAADSKEVLDCVPKLPETPSKPEAESDMEMEASYTGPKVPPPKDGEPVIVPLTEAELAKQYSNTPVDRDEASSILVEVGSEGATDTTAMSVRSLDVSDAVSMDSISTVDDSAINPAGQVATLQRATTPSDDVKSVTPLAAPTESPAPQLVAKSSSVQKEVMAQEEAKSSTVKEISTQEEKNSFPAQEKVNSSLEQEANQNSVQHRQQHCNDSSAAQPQSSSVLAESPVLTSTPAPAPNPAVINFPRNGTMESPVQKDITQVQSSKPDKTSNSPVKQVSENYVPSSPAINNRKFVPNPAFPPELMDPASHFSVVSYNILAECHWKRGDYSFTPVEYMELGYRHALLMKELDYLEGDIVCLQEVEPKYYKDTLLPAMTARGYSGSFIRRTQDYYNEGEATFVKNSRFVVKSSEGVSLKELAYKEIDESGLSSEVSSAVKQYLDRADVILLTQLECLKTGKTLTLANIHVVYAPPAPDVQCIQIACAIKQLVAKAGSDLNPHIICGDFNSKVTMAGYQLAKDGYLSDEHIRKLQTLEALTNTDGSSRSLIHHLWRAFQHTSSNLKSAYEVSMGKEPIVTSYTSKQHGCLDYVFFSSASLDTVGVLETLDPDVINASKMPSANIPSDHLSMKAVFRIK